MRQVNVFPGLWPGRTGLEVVERKGVGHPDTIADGIAELASIQYSHYCLENYGAVLHHNFDKVAVFGGLADFNWTRGEYRRPFRIVFGGRASRSFGNAKIPLEDILESAAREQLMEVLRSDPPYPVEFVHMTTDSSMFEHWFSPRSHEDLPELFDTRSNDTAFITSTWPLSTVEKLAFETERCLWDHKWVGTDIKVLVVRNGQNFDVAVTAPALVGYFTDANAYKEAAFTVKKELAVLWDEQATGKVHLTLRAFDDVETFPYPTYQECYVNLSGSSLDYGEDGLVGRGNGRHGLISPAAGAGNETCFGKNPMYHVGKVGGWLADRTAQAVGAPTRISLAYRRGALYCEPMLALAHVEHERDRERAIAALEQLGSFSWVEDLVYGERYRIRKV